MKEKNEIKIDKIKDYDCCDEIYCDWFKCPNCNSIYIRIGDNYCSNCGIKLIWNE